MIYIDSQESTNGVDSYLYYRSEEDYGTQLPDIEKNELILTQSMKVKDIYSLYNVKFLSEYIGIQENIGLYELFSFFFDGKIQNDFEMVKALFNGFLVDSNWCFCLKIGVTFCWFTVSDTKLVKLGTLQFSETATKYTVGKFIKRLRYKIVESGINLNRIKFLVWNDLNVGIEFKNYIYPYSCLETFFSSIEGFKGFDIENVMHFLSKESKIKYIVSAENFVDCLNDSFNTLKICQKNGVLYSRDVYYKDFSTCVCNIVNQKNCSYGLIIDCEGKLNGDGSVDAGCRELGGLIYCKYNKILVNIDTFSCDELLLEDTLLQTLYNYKEFSGGLQNNISVLVFGKSDIKMLKSSINQVCSKRNAKSILNRLKFIDCQPYILGTVDRNRIDGKNTLTNIAKSIGAMPVIPKHKPVNDARTLFNILAVLLNEGHWVDSRKY